MSDIPHIKCELCRTMVPVLREDTLKGNCCAFVWINHAKNKVANVCRQCLQEATSDFAAQYCEKRGRE